MKQALKIYIDSYRGLSTESWMLAIVMLLNRTGSMVLPFLGVYMADQLGFGLEDAGLVLAMFGVGAVVGSWFGGFITDKIGEYYVQIWSLLLSVPMFLLLPHFTTVASLATIMLVHAIICETFRPANAVAITKYAKPEGLTKAFTLNRMAVNLGFSIGPALGGVLSAISYDFLFYSNALAAFVAAMMYMVFFWSRNKQFKLQKKNNDAPKTAQPKERSPYLNKAFLLFCFVCLLFSVCFFQLLNTLPQFYKVQVQLDQKMIGYLLGFSGIVVVSLEMVMVNLAERYWSIVRTMVVGTLLCLVSFALIGVSEHIGILFLSIAFLSLGEIYVLPYMATITAEASGKYNKGAYMGMNGVAVSLSFIISPILGSKIASNFGFSTLWIGTAVLLLLATFGFYWSIKWLQKQTKV